MASLRSRRIHEASTIHTGATVSAVCEMDASSAKGSVLVRRSFDESRGSPLWFDARVDVFVAREDDAHIVSTKGGLQLLSQSALIW